MHPLPIEGLVNQRHPWAAIGACCLVVLLGGASCNSRDGRGDPRVTKSQSIEAARRFLSIAVRGDSAELASVADSATVSDILEIHRQRADGMLQAAAATMRRPRVTRYPGGADVIYDYDWDNLTDQGIVGLTWDGEAM